MVQSPTTVLTRAVAQALRSGHSPDDIRNMVTEVINDLSTPPPADAGDVVYDELPDGLIDLPSACRKYGVKRQTANGWMRKHDIPYLGRLRAPAPGGGYNVTDEIAFKRMSRRNSIGGRPKKYS